MVLFYFELFFFFFLCLSILVQQPLAMGGVLLFISFMVSIYVSFFFSSWYSFSLFLIYIGGMLVLFGYVMVLVPNFVFSFKSIFFCFFSVFLLFFFCSKGELFDFFPDFSFSFFGFSNFFLYLGLSLVLFVGLVSVAKICFFQAGAFRPFYLFFYV
uniref:NADH dehydrogenase subunit 6 n=1 Tax=Gononemertes parasita TaxID=649615 RepID=A0A075CG82_9BILA|nr:NADH dehydrogenase subunit 6 [Gononemertes parasita]AGZ63889.1 NADH dehydrogenase subunit 6 [Gononemertes parasita]